MVAKGGTGTVCACGATAPFSDFVVFGVRAVVAVAVADTIRTTGADSPVTVSGRTETVRCGSVVLRASGRTGRLGCDASNDCACHADGAANASRVATASGCTVAARCGARTDNGCGANASAGRSVALAVSRVGTVTNIADALGADGNVANDGKLERALNRGTGSFVAVWAVAARPVVAARLSFRLGWTGDGAATAPKTDGCANAGMETADATRARIGWIVEDEAAPAVRAGICKTACTTVCNAGDATEGDGAAGNGGAAAAAVFCGAWLRVAAASSGTSVLGTEPGLIFTCGPRATASWPSTAANAMPAAGAAGAALRPTGDRRAMSAVIATQKTPFGNFCPRRTA